MKGVAADLEASPPRLTFGPTALGAPRVLELSLTNRSRATLHVRELLSSLPSVVIENGSNFSLAAGEQRKLKVRFTPEVEGELTGQLEIRTDREAEEGGRATLPLSGLGVRSQVVVALNLLDFGAVELGTSSVKTVPVRNVSLLPTRVRLHFSGSDSDQFQGDRRSPELEIPAGEMRQLPIAFHPMRLGAAEAALRVSFCDGCEPVSVRLLGTGTISALDISPLRVDFGRVGLGSRAERKVQVRNLGTDPVHFKGAALSKGASGLEVLPAPERILASGQSLELTVLFSPLTTDSVSDLLVLALDAGNVMAGGVRIPVTGEVGSSCLLVVPRAVPFGVVAEGMTVEKRVDVHNRCLQDVAVSEVKVQDAQGGSFTLVRSPTSFSVPSQGMQSLSVAFTPATGAGKSEGFLTFVADEVGVRSTEVVTLTGEGRVFPECDFLSAPEALDFGKVTVGHTVTVGFGIENTGKTPCFLSGMQLSPDTDAVFTTTPVPAMVLDPGQRAVLPVTFQPPQAQRYEGTAEGSVNHKTQGHPTAPLRGEGVEACLVLEPGTADFGMVKVGCAPRVRKVLARNMCAADVTLKSAALTAQTSPGAELGMVQPPSLPRLLKAGEQASFELSYEPRDDGADTALFRVESSLGDFHTAGVIGRGTLRGTRTEHFQQKTQSKVDVLFVIDNSGSMMEEQSSLAANFAAFLSAAQAQYVDYQIAVTTTGLLPSPGGWSTCPGGVHGGEGGRLFPVNGSTPRIITPHTSNAAEVFARNVQVGWCHWNEQGLEAAYLALTPPLVNSSDDTRSLEPNDGNAGFLRPDAKLAIVFLSDEEDFSPQDTSFYEAFFRSVKGSDPSRVSVSAIVGPEDLSTCPTASSSGTRYMALARATGGVIENICTGNWAGSLQKLSANAFGPNRRFELSSPAANPSEIRVEVDGTPVTSGWTYDAGTQSVMFEPTHAPASGSTVSITYTLGC